MRRAIFSLLILALFFGVTAFPAYAQTRGGRDRVTFGRDAVVRAGETVEGNLVAFGAQAIVEAGGRVDGDVVAIGGNASVDGEVRGSVVTWGGNAAVASSAVVGSDVVSVGGNVRRAAGARVEGGTVEGLDFGRALRQFGWAGGPFRPPAVDGGPALEGWLRDFLGRAFATAGLLLLSVVVVLFLPNPTRRVGHTIADAPVASFGIGFLTSLAAAFLLPLLAILSTVLLVLCIGLFGYALLGVLGVGLVLAMLYGWIAAGLLVGERLLGALHVEEQLPVIAVLLGVLLISALGAFPCLGGIFSFLVACLGLGAVVLSRGGMQAYPVPVVPPSPPAVRTF